MQCPHQPVDAINVLTDQSARWVIPWGLHGVELAEKRVRLMEGFVIERRGFAGLLEGVPRFGDVDGVQVPRKGHAFEEVMQRSVGVDNGLRNRHKP